MKKWLLNAKIRKKLLLMTGIAIIGIVILGFIANYFFTTGNSVKTMVEAQRTYNLHYHKSIELFYKYLAMPEPDSMVLAESQEELRKANNNLSVFRDIYNLLENNSRQEIIDMVLESNPETFKGNRKKVGKLLSRINLLSTLNSKYLNASIESASDAYDNGLLVDHLTRQFLSDRSTANLDSLSLAIDNMTELEENYATAISSVSEYVNKILVVGLILSVLILGLLIFFLSSSITSIIAVPVNKIVEHLRLFALGNLRVDIDVNSDDEIGQLGQSLSEMQKSLLVKVDQAKEVANGNYSVEVSPNSENDELSFALNNMTRSLKENADRIQKENWLKNNQAELSNAVQNKEDLNEIGNTIISLLAKQMDALIGAVYVRKQDLITMIGSYAYTVRKRISTSFKVGEGLVGQVALERQAIIISQVPDDYLKVMSGLGETVPKNLLVLPCIYKNQVIAIIELGFLEEIPKYRFDYLEQVSENIAIAVNSSLSRTELKELLIKSQELTEKLQVQQEELKQTNEEMQVQQEELRQANEELETQTKALKESEANLQAQQEELRVTNEELSERTKAIELQNKKIQLANDDLKKAQEEIELKAKDLELASKYKSEFLANMSHELRTPLNSILVLSQLLGQNKDSNLSERQVSSAKTIYSSGASLLNLINEILDLSKVESGKLDLNIEKVSIKTMIDELQESFKPLADEKNLDFKIDIGDDVPDTILTDHLRAQQILRNLMSNAIKFTSQGSVKIEVRKDSYEGIKGECIAFKVKDSGIGIPEDKQKLIFEAFKQADGTTTRQYGGTGLGLTISKNFASVLHGAIGLVSTLNEGTEFTLYLPLSIEKKEETVKSIAAKSNEDIKPSKPSTKDIVPGKKAPEKVKAEEVADDRTNIKKNDVVILIIEDDPDFSQILYELSHEKQFKCLIARNGETGLHYADYYQPNAIILDIGLPGIDGWEVMDRLKENPNTRHIPVHFMSGTDKSIDALKKGAIGFLTKPVSLEQINTAFTNIEQLISKSVKKVLVVEDDEGMRKGIIELIGNQEIEIVSAGTGQEALEKVKAEKYDCMILDLGLSDMSGFELLKKIGKKGSTNDQMPIIIYTGKDLTRKEEEQLQKYSDRIIIKGAKSPERLLAETTLFLHQVESKLPEEKQQMLKSISDREDVFKNKTVLIVDDDMRNVFAVSSLLEDAGLQILVGKNGKEGITRLENADQVDLILMDIMMPEMNGYEAMENIRKMPKFRNLPIIALTAKAMQGDREKCINAGANDYLTKPIDSDKLISLLRVWLYQ